MSQNQQTNETPKQTQLGNCDSQANNNVNCDSTYNFNECKLDGTTTIT